MGWHKFDCRGRPGGHQRSEACSLKKNEFIHLAHLGRATQIPIHSIGILAILPDLENPSYAERKVCFSDDYKTCFLTGANSCFLEGKDWGLVTDLVAMLDSESAPKSLP